jgi:hypothetical protein
MEFREPVEKVFFRPEGFPMGHSGFAAALSSGIGRSQRFRSQFRTRKFIPVFFGSSPVVLHEMVSQKRAFFSADLATNCIEQFYLDLAVVDPCVFECAFPTPKRPDAVNAGNELGVTALDSRDIQRLPPAIELLDFTENGALVVGEGHEREY